MRSIIILISFLFSLNLFSDPISRGRIIYEKSGIKKENKKQETRNNNNSSIDKGTVLNDAIDSKVLINYEYWDKNGKRRVGTCTIPQPENVKSGITYGDNGTEFTGSYISGLITNVFHINTNHFVLKTGQIVSYRLNDNGTYRIGYTGGYTNSDGSWNGNTRFTTNVQNNFGRITNTLVKDNVTGLIWTRNANQYGQMVWNNAVDGATSCIVGGYNDWRLPNRFELESLLDLKNYNPALPTGHPFYNVQNIHYWVGTTYTPVSTYAWEVNFSNGNVSCNFKTMNYYVWYVRN